MAAQAGATIPAVPTVAAQAPITATMLAADAMALVTQVKHGERQSVSLA